MEKMIKTMLAAMVSASGVFFVVNAHAWDPVTTDRLFVSVGNYTNTGGSI